MANQHKESFAHIAPKKFGKSAEELLRDFSKDGLTYMEAAKKSDIQTCTMRKWCAHYDIQLKSLRPSKKPPAIEKINLKSQKIDTSNFLYRKWQPIPKTNQSLAGL